MDGAKDTGSRRKMRRGIAGRRSIGENSPGVVVDGETGKLERLHG